jgi:hypothetical protein
MRADRGPQPGRAARPQRIHITPYPDEAEVSSRHDETRRGRPRAAQIGLPILRSRKLTMPRSKSVFAASFRDATKAHGTVASVRREGYELVGLVRRGTKDLVGGALVHAGMGGSICCGGLGGSYPSSTLRGDIVAVPSRTARASRICATCALIIHRGFRQRGPGRPPRGSHGLLVARFRSGALDEQDGQRPRFRYCRPCLRRRAGVDSDCAKCSGTGLIPPPRSPDAPRTPTPLALFPDLSE